MCVYVLRYVICKTDNPSLHCLAYQAMIAGLKKENGKPHEDIFTGKTWNWCTALIYTLYWLKFNLAIWILATKKVILLIGQEVENTGFIE